MFSFLILSLSLLFAHAAPAEAPYDTSRPASANTIQSPEYPLPVHALIRDPTIRFENLAIRSNGQILTTSTSPNASIYQVDPLGILPLTLIYTVPNNITSACGIVEAEQDIFYFVSADINLRSPFNLTPSSYSITKLNVSGLSVLPNGTLSKPPTAKRVANLTAAALPNGAAFAGPKSDNLLVADTIRGLIWNVNIRTGFVGVTLNDTSTKGITSSGETASGVNGIKVHNDTMYYDSTGASALYKVSVDAQGNIPTGAKPSLITTNLTCDDLVIDNDGTAYVAGTLNVLTRVSSTGEKVVIAGTFNSTSSSLGGPTAARFGRSASDRWSLYVTTNGGLDSPVPDSQGVSRIDLRY